VRGEVKAHIYRRAFIIMRRKSMRSVGEDECGENDERVSAENGKGGGSMECKKYGQGIKSGYTRVRRERWGK
jgi:hypothetical protein